ncbi:hypothetical protein [Actinoplanes sp. NPDC026623]|uniref:hypothetical protein n=1 Tax=Actinoplanes sp. NPDC026623 TaxID=3155610 RepID=UPI0033CAF08E
MEEDCSTISAAAVYNSAHDQNRIKLLKVRAPRIVVDNRRGFTAPKGSSIKVALACTGTGTWSNGNSHTKVHVELRVDSDGEGFILFKSDPGVSHIE